jgi:plasmid stability protein
MSTSITIGEVPDEVRDEIVARAAVCGCSVEEYIRDELIALARRPSAAVWMARVRARKEALQNELARGRGSAGGGTSQSAGAQPRVEAAAGLGSEPRASEPRASEAPLTEPRRDVG